MSGVGEYAALVERGCLCGTDDVASCPVHPEPGDLRGIGAYSRAGTPNGFPMDATCAICGESQCLLYPNIEIDDPKRSGEFRPTLVCPHCSGPAQERGLRTDAEQFGYKLKAVSVFGLAEAATA